MDNKDVLQKMFNRYIDALEYKEKEKAWFESEETSWVGERRNISNAELERLRIFISKLMKEVNEDVRC